MEEASLERKWRLREAGGGLPTARPSAHPHIRRAWVWADTRPLALTSHLQPHGCVMAKPGFRSRLPPSFPLAASPPTQDCRGAQPRTPPQPLPAAGTLPPRLRAWVSVLAAPEGGRGRAPRRSRTSGPLLGSHTSWSGAGLTWGSGTSLMTPFQPWCGRVAFPHAACPCRGVVWRTHRPQPPALSSCPGGSPISGHLLASPTSPDLTPEVTMVLVSTSRDSGVGPDTAVPV